jgi:suppressor of fused protein SUFU
MDYQRFYIQLFQPIEERIGRIDDMTMAAIVGFDCGGPVSLATVGYGREPFVTYVTCELAVRDEQQPAEFGRYELMMTCDDEAWARHILTKIGQMSMEDVFEHGHTVDIGQVFDAGGALQGLVVEEFARVTVDGRAYGILRLHGVTRSELEFAMELGADELLERLRRADIYPRTSIHRRKSVETAA